MKTKTIDERSGQGSALPAQPANAYTPVSAEGEDGRLKRGRARSPHAAARKGAGTGPKKKTAPDRAWLYDLLEDEHYNIKLVTETLAELARFSAQFENLNRVGALNGNCDGADLRQLVTELTAGRLRNTGVGRLLAEAPTSLPEHHLCIIPEEKAMVFDHYLRGLYKDRKDEVELHEEFCDYCRVAVKVMKCLGMVKSEAADGPVCLHGSGVGLKDMGDFAEVATSYRMTAGGGGDNT